MASTDELAGRRASNASQPRDGDLVASAVRARDRGRQHRHAGRWILLDARFLRVVSVGAHSYPGIAPKMALDPIAKRILLPRIRAAGRLRTEVTDIVQDLGRQWHVRAEPLVGAHSGLVLAVRGCYWPVGQTMPAAPPLGCWELRLTPPGPGQSMRTYWSPGLFTVHDRAVPDRPGPLAMDYPLWLDELVVEADRAETRLVQEELAAATTDALHFHTFRTRAQSGAEHRIRSVIWRDLSEPGPDIWLRGVSMRTTEPEADADPARAATRFLDAILTLGPDPVCAIETTYEQMFLTTARFGELGVLLPADRHLPVMCHQEDLTALRVMLTEATANPHAVTGPVQVRFARPDGWTTLELRGTGVRRPGRPTHHVLCLVQRPADARAGQAA